MMGVMMFNGIQSALTPCVRLLRASQPSQGLKIVVVVGHNSPWNNGDQCKQLQHLQQSHLSGGPLVLLVALRFVPDQDLTSL